MSVPCYSLTSVILTNKSYCERFLLIIEFFSKCLSLKFYALNNYSYNLLTPQFFAGLDFRVQSGYQN